jgi:predicted HNH restriction endonuclease
MTMAYRADMGFYDTAEWSVARRQALHDGNYRCARCDVSLVGLGPRAVHQHHRRELKAAPSLRSERQNLLPVCRPCHTALHKARHKYSVNVDGTPNEPNHPWFKAT